MNYQENLFFVSGEEKSGTGILIPQKKILITTNQIVANRWRILIKTNSGKKIIPIIFTDTILNLAVANASEIDNDNAVKINFISRPISVNQTVEILGKNLFNHLIKKDTIISEIDNIYSNKVFKTADILTEQTDGGLVVDIFGNILGISQLYQNEKKQIIIPNEIISYVINHLEKDHFKPSIRCPVCHKIIKKENIIDQYCPNCGIKINKNILGMKEIPKNETIKKIEQILTELNKNIQLSIIGKNLWEIEQGSATIYIRYSPKEKFITAFSPLTKLKDKNIEQVLDFLLTENQKLTNMSFAIHNQYIFLVSYYIYEKDFSIDLGKKIFFNLSQTADHYDDIIIKMQVQ